MKLQTGCIDGCEVVDKTGRHYRLFPGKALPFGATYGPHGVQFSIFSRNATRVFLCLFDKSTDDEPSLEIELSPEHNRTGDCWHVLVGGAGPGQHYLYRIDGPFAPQEGHRFNPNRYLIDPYAKALSGDFRWRLETALGYIPGHPDKDLSFNTTPNPADMPKCIVLDDDEFDWQGTRPLNYPMHETIIYEAHVRGITKSPTSGVEHPGTYRGIIEHIPYLKELGITSLELLPVQEFDKYEYSNRINPLTGKPLVNYWGYSTIAFFAPRSRYASAGYGGEQVREFKEMVRELHKAGIEVILDIVFNHTGEGDQMGPTINFRGIDNSIYYILSQDKRYYMNYSGCGNTMNCNHPVVRGLIIDALRYWVQEMHIDGFRFDLGSILGRDEYGNLMENPPVLGRIAEDPVLRDTKIIAEAWDAGGAYQVGSFHGGRWSEWNDRFRDTMRSYWRNDPGQVSGYATRISGSSDLYKWNGRKPYQSVNYITAHDGFTLNDLVSYTKKHNMANGEDNRDGHGNAISQNMGVEGPTDDPRVEAARNRMVKNFLMSLLIATGTPMLLGGDEIRRTQLGNNNAYCQDNEISWFDYSLKDRHADVFRFTKMLIALRKAHPALKRQEFFVGKDLNNNTVLDITWYDELAEEIDWARTSNLLAFRIDGNQTEIHSDRDDRDFYVLNNPGKTHTMFKLVPPPAGSRWAKLIDTAEESPNDILDEADAQPLTAQRIRVQAQSSVLLISVPEL